MSDTNQPKSTVPPAEPTAPAPAPTVNAPPSGGVQPTTSASGSDATDPFITAIAARLQSTLSEAQTLCTQAAAVVKTNSTAVESLLTGQVIEAVSATNATLGKNLSVVSAAAQTKLNSIDAKTAATTATFTGIASRVVMLTKARS